ncbi:hypothetical protein P879_07460 [Paragonimus westermani]|uniref:Uncharacterized protein n=1 Tax=Paragonimus westermani TaxID=34504 RepID=A0A8T0DHG5_9TREM|nr:hypothetical protein P879_07460 [Paragonimus westermani]
MKIKVATIFSFRSDSKNETNGQCSVSSTLTSEPDGLAELLDEGFHCGTEEEAVDNKCLGRGICMRSSCVSEEKFCKLKTPGFIAIGKPCSGKSTLARQLCEQFDCELETPSKLSKLCHVSSSDAFPAKVAPSFVKSLLDARKVFQGKPPRIVMVGKPCTSKTTLAKMLCNTWACRYVNASELIIRHIREGTGRGLEIQLLLQKGEDLSDSMVFNIVNEELQSSGCRQSGYILDGIPTYSEELRGVQTQLEFLARIYPSPTFWVVIDITDSELKTGWETVRCDHSTEELYFYLSDDDCVKEPTGRCDFPLIDEDTKDRLLTRYEELPENLKLHFRFYNEQVADPLEQFLNRFKPSAVIRLNGDLCPVELGQELVNRIQNASCIIQCATVPAEAPLKRSSSTERESSETPVLNCVISAKSIWKNDPPRLVILGKPCTGKTTLSKILCQAWGCRYVNASELINRHLKEESGRGLEILKLSQQGEDLSDHSVFSIVTEELQSLEYRDKGYIVDGLPNCNETLLQVPTQLEFLAQIYPEPFFWIYIDVCAIYHRDRLKFCVPVSLRFFIVREDGSTSKQ